MTVLLVLLTFAAFIAVDALLGRIRAAGAVRETTAVPVPAVSAEPVWVAGYQLPEELHYHRGHTWALAVDAHTVVVGVDDFARRLIGGAKAVAAPAAGTWVRQGDRAFAVEVDGRTANLVSPIEGEVIEVNPALKGQPGLVADEPYGRGWVFKVRPGNLPANLRNLLDGSLARRWMEDCREALDLNLMALSGSVLQDGGEPAKDFARHLAEDDWRRLTQLFLLG
jgi:glycine cleavage system H protein